MHVILGGLDRSEGVFFLLLLDTFGQSALLTAWPGAIVCTLQLVMGPVANAFCSRYSVRTGVLLGGCLMSLALLLNCFATNIYFLFFSHALLGGVGRGLVYAPGLIIVGMYFDKRVGLASGLGTSGVGIGTFLLVPLVQVMAQGYGFIGTFLLIGGFSANTLVAGMLFRPLSLHHKFTRAHKRKSQDDGHKSATTKTIRNKDFDAVCELTEGKNLKARTCQCMTSSFSICFPIETSSKSSNDKKKLFHFYLLKEPPFLLFCISIWLFAMAFRTAFTFMPALIKSKGIPEPEAAMALSVAGIVDTVGRVLAGFLLDTSLLRPFRPYLYNLVIFALAGIAFLLPSLSGIVPYCAACGVYGLLSGAYISQKSVILKDILDPGHMANSFGILIVFQGLGNLLGPPFAGAMKDNLGGYDEAFYLGGGLLLMSGLLMSISNVMLAVGRRQGKHKQKH
ncbi:monocarboxylate transporter 12-like [Physella acuta]|uniref:monocarboxylate transporter 12-like n=1 Tax=Physella acuta TaxID=109671 RepID=UPI0027DCE04F|nr:monocarboxylate transporter 12-like [Physella acuta]